MEDAVDQLRQVVLGDPELCRRLAAIEDRRECTDRLVAIGREHGLSLDVADIDREVVAARRQWLARWV